MNHGVKLTFCIILSIISESTYTFMCIFYYLVSIESYVTVNIILRERDLLLEELHYIASNASYNLP